MSSFFFNIRNAGRQLSVYVDTTTERCDDYDGTWELCKQ